MVREIAIRLPADPVFTAARKVASRLRAEGHEAYLVGGGVRDLVLGEKAHDYDVATSATPGQVQALFPRTEPVGVRFGVVLVIQDGVPIHVTTFRVEGPYPDGRRPSRVRFASLREDASRRDFTINALYLDVGRSVILDPVDGYEDLRARRLRTVGDPRARFAEDRLRLLRAVRFAAHFALDPEPAMVQAARAEAPHVRALAAERLTDEMTRLLTGPHLDRALGLLVDFGLAPWLAPQVDLPEARARAARLGGRFRRRRPAAVGWALLLWGHPAPAELLNGYRLGRRVARAAREILALARALLDFERCDVVRQKKLLRARHVHTALLVAEAAVGRSLDAVRARRAAWSRADLRPPRYLTGEDLVALGVPQGPEVGRLLHVLEDLALAGRIRSREDALAAVRQWRQQSGKE